MKRLVFVAMLLGCTRPNSADPWREACEPLEGAEPDTQLALLQDNSEHCEASLAYVRRLDANTTDTIADCLVHLRLRGADDPSAEEVLACVPAHERRAARELLDQADRHAEQLRVQGKRIECRMKLVGMENDPLGL